MKKKIFVDIDHTLIDTYKACKYFEPLFEHKIDESDPYKIFALKEDEPFSNLIPDILFLQKISLQPKFVKQNMVNLVLELSILFDYDIHIITTRFKFTIPHAELFGSEFLKRVKYISLCDQNNSIKKDIVQKSVEPAECIVDDTIFLDPKEIEKMNILFIQPHPIVDIIDDVYGQESLNNKLLYDYSKIIT